MYKNCCSAGGRDEKRFLMRRRRNVSALGSLPMVIDNYNYFKEILSRYNFWSLCKFLYKLVRKLSGFVIKEIRIYLI